MKWSINSKCMNDLFKKKKLQKEIHQSQNLIFIYSIAILQQQQIELEFASVKELKNDNISKLRLQLLKAVQNLEAIEAKLIDSSALKKLLAAIEACL